jgi:dTDP-3-amino-3,4,6-trideoxy-alpha-D-glucose transaminase
MTAAAIRFMDLRPSGEDALAVAQAMRRVIDRGWFVLGPEVEAFEQEFAAACGTAHAVAVGTGTDAIALALRAAGIGPGDEVITAPLSAAYTALAVMMTGARPVFADLDEDRLAMSPAAAEAAITSRTRALLPVHLYGQAADMGAFEALAARRGLLVIEDCAQAHLATCEGRPVGTIGAAGAFSFYPTKNLGALGDGGAIVTGDAAFAGRLRRLRNGGQSSRYHHVEFGVNSRLDELQAAVLRERLTRLPAWTARRRALAHLYRRALAGSPVIVPPECDAGHVYHLFPVRSADRDGLQAWLLQRGIETLVHYPVPIPRQPALADQAPAQCPVADRVCAELCSLPLHPALPDDAAQTVAWAVRDFVPDRATGRPRSRTETGPPR